MNQRLARPLAIGVAILSGIIAIVIGNLAVASHIPFAPNPIQFQRLSHLAAPGTGKWRAVHILAAGCLCSRSVAQHLAARGTVPGLSEAVVLVGADNLITNLIGRAQLPLTTITAAEAETRYHLLGAPWLVVVAPDDSVRYAGGYTKDRNARTGYLDVAIWRAVSSGKSFQPLPAFGCAVSQHLKRVIDPLQLKYSLNTGSF